MSLTPPIPATLKEAVAAQFAYRPTFRHVLSKAVFEAVAKRFPDHATSAVDHDNLEPYTLYRADAKGKLRPHRLLDLLLDVYLKGTQVEFGKGDKLLLQSYEMSLLNAAFEGTPGSPPPDEGAMLALKALNEDLDSQLSSLMPAFQQAQVRFWNDDDAIPPAVTGIGRHGWMRQVLRAALMGSVQSAELADDEKNCIYDVLLGTTTTLNLLVIQAHFYQTLGLKFELGISERLQQYRKSLMGRNLMLAAFAHVEVQRGNLVGPARAEVLQSAWDEYSAALIDSVDIKREGGDLVDVPMLEQFQQTLRTMKKDVGARLGQGESQGVLPYISSETPREVAYLEDGQIVVGDRVEIDGKPMLEIRNLVTGDVSARFEWVDGKWVPPRSVPEENAGPKEETDEAKKALLAQGAVLLAADKPVQEIANEYLSQHVNHRALERLIDGHVAKLQRLADALAGDNGFTAKKVQEQLAAWPERRRSLMVRLFSQTRFPDVQALRYLHEQRLLKIDYTGKRHPYRDGAFDDYEIRLLKKPGDTRGKLIWVAHFHYPRQDTPATQFSVGHLKTAQQRSYGPAEEVELAKVGQWVHRGPLRYAQVKDIIPLM